MITNAQRKLGEKLTGWRSEYGQNTKTLLKGLLSMGPLFIAARFFTAAGQIIAGRLLGPREYGLATMAVAASALLTIPINLGFSSGMLKFSSMEERPEQQTIIISTALLAYTAAAIPCCLVLYIFRHSLAAMLHIDNSLYLWSLAYSIFLSAYTMISSVPQALARFWERGWAELIYGVLAFAVFLFLFFCSNHNFSGFILSLMVALLFAGLFALYYSRDRIRLVFSKEALARMSSYFWSPIIGAVAVSLIYTATPLILANYLSPASAGILSIYELGSVGIAAVLSQILGTVLTPLTTAPSRQGGAWRKFLLLALPISAGCFIFSMISDYLALRLVGHGYPIHLSWLSLFSLAAALSIPSGAALNLLAARDAASLWLGTIGCIFSGLVSLATILWAVPRYGFLGAGLATVFSYTISLVWYLGCGIYQVYYGRNA